MHQSTPDNPDPQAFQTLRGVFAGHEPDEPPYFAYSATLRIFGESLDLDHITQQLRLTPTHSHRQGDQRGPRSVPYKHAMWLYKPPVPEEQPLAVHIDALWAAIQHAPRYLRALKQTATVDVFLGYRSNIDHAGVTIPPTSLTLFMALEIPFVLSIIITE